MVVFQLANWRFRDTGTFGRSNFGHGGVPIRHNSYFETLALLAGQILAMVVSQFAKMAISRHWHFWQVKFWPGWCSNSPKWRFRDTDTFGRSNFGQGGVPIRQTGDFETLALLAGQILAMVVFQFATMAISRHYRFWQAK